jgi:hypothetical protein
MVSADRQTARMQLDGIKMDHKTINQRLRLLYALGDFQMALSAAAFLGECDPDQKYTRVELRRFRCYETALIMGYTRPFTGSRGGKVPRLSIKMTGAELSPKQHALHDNLMVLRNKVIAHSDEDMMRIVSQTHQMPLPLGNEPPFFIFLETVFDEGLALLGYLTLSEVHTLLFVVFTATYTKLLKEAQLRPTDFDIRLNDRINPRPFADPTASIRGPSPTLERLIEALAVQVASGR